MKFYRPDPDLTAAVQASLDRALSAFGGMTAEDVALTCVLQDGPGVAAGPPRGASWRGDVPLYPASVVKLFYMAALMAWEEAGLLILGDEDRRALRAMVGISSNNATSYVVDRLTGASDGAELPEPLFAVWRHRREAVQRLVQAWGWPELEGTRILHKTYDEGPYGLEAAFRRLTGPNLLTTDATARLVHGIAAGTLLGAERCREMLGYMDRCAERTPEGRAMPENQVAGFLVEAMPDAARVWSKAGWTSTTRHDALHAEMPDGRALTLVVFTTGESLAASRDFLPELGRRLLAEPAVTASD